MPITSLTSYFNTSSFGDTNASTRNQKELSLTLDSAARQLADFKGLALMSAGGGAFEVGKLLATTFFSAVPVLSAIPLLTRSFTFVSGVTADTAFTTFLSQIFGEAGENDIPFWQQVLDQGSVRGMGLLGAGQGFAVMQLLTGLASLSGGVLCEKEAKPEQGGMLGSMIQGLRCYFGSGTFGYLSGGAVSAVEQRISLRTRNMNNVGANLVFAQNKGRSPSIRLAGRQVSPLLAGAAGADVNTKSPRIFHAQGTSDQGSSSLDGTDLIPSASEQRRLTAQFRPHFSSDSNNPYSEQLLWWALQTPSRQAHFHERLLAVYAMAPNPGTKEQVYLAKAIHHVSTSGTSRNPVGSFKSSLLHFAISRALADGNPHLRNRKMQEIFQAMESGLDTRQVSRILNPYREELRLLARSTFPNSFWQSHRAKVEEELPSYSVEEQVLILNWIHAQTAPMGSQKAKTEAERMITTFGKARRSGKYRQTLIQAVLAKAKSSPQGRLILQRAFDIFYAEEEISKLMELATPPDPHKTVAYVKGLTEDWKLATLASMINGTSHTAYMEDIRLARKVVSVSLDAEEDIPNEKRRSEAKTSLDQACLSFISSKAPLTPDFFLGLLRRSLTPQILSFLRSYREEKFEIRILSTTEFDTLSKRSPHEPHACLFRPATSTTKAQILIREMPGSFSSPTQAYQALTDRLIGLVHEWEHWRHFSGNYEGMEEGGRAISLERITRHDRLVSEMLADLEDLRWQTKVFGLETWRICHLLGENPATYLRDKAEQIYFG